MYNVHRSKHNPILSPDDKHPWEAHATFNGCPVRINSRKIAMLYRAMSRPEPFENHHFTLSVIGRATSRDGFHFSDRKVFIEPEAEWERYGCEDPRTTKIGNTYFTFYTALSAYPFRAEGIRVAVALSNDLEKVTERHAVTPFNAKAMTLFPEKINGKLTAILAVDTDRMPVSIGVAQFDNVEDIWNKEKWEEWYKNIGKHTIELHRSNDEQVEIGSPPLKTRHGWLLIYSHIKKYSTSEKLFGIEAVLLDLKDPKKIIGRTSSPILVPEEAYEKYGILPNIVFPSGALIEDDTLRIYYGGADTTCAVANVSLSQLILSMTGKRDSIVRRFSGNPILSPTKNNFEERDVLNPAALECGKNIHLLYRAMSLDNTSTVGYARLGHNGSTILERSDKPIYVPRMSFEQKNVPNGNSGCEDPRLTEIGDRIYMCYTAYNGTSVPAVALTSISTEDFLNKEWHWSMPELISPPGVDDKDACVVPFVKNGKHLFLHRIDNAMCASYIDLVHPNPATHHVEMLSPRPGMWDSKKVGISSPPMLIKQGWLLVYHGVSDDGVYRVGLALLDKKNPVNVIARTTDFIFEPEMPYELSGEIAHVVFPCGTVIQDGKLYMYYGGGDRVIGLAIADVKELLKMLK